MKETAVLEEGAARAKRDEEAAEKAGFSVAPPVYEIGSQVNEIGAENFRQSRKDFEAMPTAEEACERLSEQVQEENRRDRKVRLPGLTMLGNGKIQYGPEEWPITERGFLNLASFATPGGGSYLRHCPSELRAENINHWLQEAYREDASETKHARAKARARGRPDPGPVYVEKEGVLRTRINHSDERREIFSVVGPRYRPHDVDKIAEQVMRGVSGDARSEIIYDGYRARINVLFHSDIKPENAVAGEIFKAGVSITTADDGTESIKVAAEIWRNLCLNLIIVDHDKEYTLRRRHKGDGIKMAVEEGIAAAMKKVDHFVQAWSKGAKENVLKEYELDTMDDVFRGLIHNKVISVPGVKDPHMLARLQKSWQEEPGYTKTSVVNAVTRAAHEYEYKSWTHAQELERVSGQLLFSNKWNVHIPEDAKALV